MSISIEELLGRAVSDARDERGMFDPYDECGLTAALAEAITEEDHFAKDASGKLYHYEVGRYRPQGEGCVALAVKELLWGSNASAKWSVRLVPEVKEYIRVDAPALRESPPVHLINLRNGILDIEPRELLAQSPELLSPVQIPVE